MAQAVLKGLLGQVNVVNERGIMYTLYVVYECVCVLVHEATIAFCSLCMYVHAP